MKLLSHPAIGFFITVTCLCSGYAVPHIELAAVSPFYFVDSEGWKITKDCIQVLAWGVAILAGIKTIKSKPKQ